jgi:hypothetical protein
MTSRVAGSPEDRFQEHAVGMILHTAAASPQATVLGVQRFPKHVQHRNLNSSVGKGGHLNGRQAMSRLGHDILSSPPDWLNPRNFLHTHTKFLSRKVRD